MSKLETFTQNKLCVVKAIDHIDHIDHIDLCESHNKILEVV